MPIDWNSVLASAPDQSNPNALNTFQRNQQYAAPQSVMKPGYSTTLDPLNEMAFQQWVKTNNIPFDPSATSDYDMRGYFQAMKNGQAGGTSMNANDGMPHFTDQFKTPYHESFSNESQYANPQTAPRWNVFDSLQDQQTGQKTFDERRANALLKALGGR